MGACLCDERSGAGSTSDPCDAADSTARFVAPRNVAGPAAISFLRGLPAVSCPASPRTRQWEIA
ncbi:hypothetical protein GLE_0596 [Lysobacter enzymogenes]|uniref:Uncharacterized protein n=1 Tax=Lysobacter enzymogenes TaxID=69 RepID=A0A0S2DBQ9_LYSEN|nr:hypothetical protein GLE_0596 [Lysobacter enzymogenes]